MATSKRAILTQLKKILREASDEKIIKLASLQTAFAIFPEACESVQINPYFTHDHECPDRVKEEYWQQLGTRTPLCLDILDDDLLDLQEDWLDELEFAVEDTPLERNWEVIKELLDLGLAAKAEKIRRRVLASQLEEAIETALTEYSERKEAWA